MGLFLCARTRKEQEKNKIDCSILLTMTPVFLITALLSFFHFDRLTGLLRFLSFSPLSQGHSTLDVPRTSRNPTQCIVSLFANCFYNCITLRKFALLPLSEKGSRPTQFTGMDASQHWASKMTMEPKQPKRPKRPPSAYNIFYAFESKRLKRRENALARFHAKFQSGKSQPKLNCTQAIGRKWSKGREEKAFVLFFDLIREGKVKEYCMRKELFLAETTFNRFDPSHDVESCGTCSSHQTQKLALVEVLGEEETRGDSAKKREDVRKAKALVDSVRDSKVSREKLVKALMGHTARALNRIIDDVDGCRIKFGTNARNGPYERARKLVLEALGEEDTRPERGSRAQALLSLEIVSLLT